MTGRTTAISNGDHATSSVIRSDVIVIGAGFSGITAIHRLRQRGLTVKALEAGSDLGGTWHWSRYPGARVDCEIPYYQLNIPEILASFSFTEKYPDQYEVRRYISHVDKTLDISRDVIFNARVNDVSWQADSATWRVHTENGLHAECKYLMLCTGAVHHPVIPDFENMSAYKGKLVHSGAYPEDLAVKDKRVVVVGSGSSAVGVVQEVGKLAKHMHVLVREPSYCYPMRQRKFSKAEQAEMKIFLPAIMEHSRHTNAGFHTLPQTRKTFEVSEEERMAVFERGWEMGGFSAFVIGFPDMTVDAKSNRAWYDFWRSKTQHRLTDPKKRAIMCPDEPLYLINTKRPPLEQDYYEVLDQPNVDIVDLRITPVAKFQENGIVLSHGTSIDADVVIMATGYDGWIGSLNRMGIKNKNGEPLEQVWSNKIFSYLALTIPGFPNMFFSYNAHSPAAFSNGPTCIELCTEVIVDMIVKLEKENVRTFEARQDAADAWIAGVEAATNQTLFPLTNSWYNRSNVKGAKRQHMMYVKGLQEYKKECYEAMDGWKGFDIVAN